VYISRQNQQLLFTLILCGAVALLVGYLITHGLDVLGEKERVLKLADDLAACSTYEEYRAFLESQYPSDSLVWLSPALSDQAEATTPPATLEPLPDGRMQVVVFASTVEGLLKKGTYAYLPAALVDEQGHGWHLSDVRFNSRKSDIVFEYYFAPPGGKAPPPIRRRYRFFYGRWRLILEPSLGGR